MSFMIIPLLTKSQKKQKRKERNNTNKKTIYISICRSVPFKWISIHKGSTSLPLHGHQSLSAGYSDYVPLPSTFHRLLDPQQASPAPFNIYQQSSTTKSIHIKYNFLYFLQSIRCIRASSIIFIQIVKATNY